MPSTKKASKKNKTQKLAVQEYQTTYAPQFRQLLLSARKSYAKGRSYDAVELQREALQLGSDKMIKFNENSLVKAHALLELGLACSAIMTDFALETTEWTQWKQQMKDALGEAIQIFKHRVAAKTLTRFRKDECWMRGGDYHSPVPHTERLGPLDYLSCANLCTGAQDPTDQTVQILKTAIQFGVAFQANGCQIQLEGGPILQGELPPDSVDRLQTILKEHKAVLAGEKTTEEAMAKLSPDDDEPEVRHAGTRLGKMKLSEEKLVKDVDKKGLRNCENPACQHVERQPRQFGTCKRCNWVSYCCRQCQVDDWKRHKKECKTEAAQKRTKYEEQNKDKSSLQYGQSQQLLTIVSYLQHYATTSKEMASSQTVDAVRVMTMVRPKIDDSQELGTLQLGMQEVGLVWNALWSMQTKDRDTMIQRFIKEVQDSHSFPKGGPDFGVVADWGRFAVAGDFAVVKHTPNGSILLHDNGDGAIKAYCVVGITQSVESLLAAKSPLPHYINTAILPFKGLILCQGTIMPSLNGPSSLLEETANEYMKGKAELDVSTSLVFKK